MPPRRARLATAIALAGVLVLPNMSIAGEPETGAPPAPVVTWQEHLEHMRAIGANRGSHVGDCIAEHGSLAGMMGQRGMMVDGMAGMMSEEVRP